MIFSFDLISDLHVETWKQFDWTGQPTAPYCVVAGDVARDRALVIDTLEHLSQQYKGVFYIDGNEEHKDYAEELDRSYHELRELVNAIPNVVFMQDNVIIVNDIALLATNGWWTYDFDPDIAVEQSMLWVCDKDNISQRAALSINGIAYHDAAYLTNSLRKLQTHKEVKAIVLVSHTVPAPWIIEHDLDLIHSTRFNAMGNSYLDGCLVNDTENKVKAWCFGHYHRQVDQIRSGIRYVNNTRGRGNTEYCQQVYFPKRITIKY